MDYLDKEWKTKSLDNDFVNYFNLLIDSTLNIPEKNVYEFMDWAPNERYYISWKAARYLSNLSGDFVQCGVFKGEEAFYMAKECIKTLHLFDSWNGSENIGQYDSDYYIKNNFKCSIDEAKIVLSEFKNVQFHHGRVPFNFDKVNSISFLNIDLDLYEPTRISLEHLWPKVIDGGMALIDFHDGVSTGAEKATMDYFTKTKHEIKVLPTGKCMVVKK
jgi:hypothetical protein